MGPSQHHADQYAKTLIGSARKDLARLDLLNRRMILKAMVRAYTGLAAEHVPTRDLVELLCELSEALLADRSRPG